MESAAARQDHTIMSVSLPDLKLEAPTGQVRFEALVGDDFDGFGLLRWLFGFGARHIGPHRLFDGVRIAQLDRLSIYNWSNCPIIFVRKKTAPWGGCAFGGIVGLSDNDSLVGRHGQHGLSLTGDELVPRLVSRLVAGKCVIVENNNLRPAPHQAGVFYRVAGLLAGHKKHNINPRYNAESFYQIHRHR